jgi:guanylate kinase
VAADPRLWLSRSWTTRPRRPGEAEDAYEFVDPATFQAAAAEGRFLEHAQFLGHLYGTPVPEPPEDRDVVLEIEVQGARQVRARHPDAVVVLLVPPDLGVQEERLRGRGDDEDAVLLRLAKGQEEVAELRAFADAVVVNDDVDRAVGEVQDMIERYRRARPVGRDRPSFDTPA